jgi:hypothetical protein
MSEDISPNLKAILAGLPPRVDRRRGADIVTQHFFPVSARTLERWPLAVQHVNGRSLIVTSELFKVAGARLEAAPAVMTREAKAAARVHSFAARGPRRTLPQRKTASGTGRRTRRLSGKEGGSGTAAR